MRTISTFLVVLSSLAQPALAQMSCTEELFACTNGCVAGGVLGVLATKGNSAATRAMESCNADCESRNATCTRREEEAQRRQQQIDAERAAVEARRQAAERRQHEIANAKQREIDQRVDHAMIKFEKEWNLLWKLHLNRPKSDVKSPAEPKPAAVLAAAKQLEETDPLIARKLYLQLSDRKDEFGKQATSALRRFRQPPGGTDQELTRLGETPSIVATLVQQSAIRKLSEISISAPTTSSAYVTYQNGVKKSVGEEIFLNIGEGYIYRKFSTSSGSTQQLSILAGLLPVFSLRSSPIQNSKRVLTDLSLNGNPFAFVVGNEFSYTATYEVIAKNNSKEGKYFGSEKFSYNCRTTIADKTTSIIDCKRKYLGGLWGAGNPNEPEHNLTFAFIHQINVFSWSKNFNIGEGERPNNWDTYLVELLPAERYYKQP